jgi:cobyrinic acid a,c-diamide synthase
VKVAAEIFTLINEFSELQREVFMTSVLPAAVRDERRRLVERTARENAQRGALDRQSGLRVLSRVRREARAFGMMLRFDGLSSAETRKELKAWDRHYATAKRTLLDLAGALERAAASDARAQEERIAQLSRMMEAQAKLLALARSQWCALSAAGVYQAAEGTKFSPQECRPFSWESLKASLGLPA